VPGGIQGFRFPVPFFSFRAGGRWGFKKKKKKGHDAGGGFDGGVHTKAIVGEGGQSVGKDKLTGSNGPHVCAAICDGGKKKRGKGKKSEETKKGIGGGSWQVRRK